jgi:S1-C subfamily serine protease
VIRDAGGASDDEGMTTSALASLSSDLASIVDRLAPSVVQVHGRRRPASGVAFETGAVLTTVRALGREDGLRVRRHDGETADAELIGWDPSTGLAVLRTSLALAPAVPSDAEPRVGHIAIAIARSWSNAVTASAGLVSVIGGPLPTGRHRSIERVLRTSAPMHDGFAGGAFADTSARIIGITTASAIRGLQVVIPASIAWTAASEVLKHGRPRRGYLGVAGQAVALGGRQREAAGAGQGVLIVGVSPDGPADTAGVIVGDVVLAFDGSPVASTDDLVHLAGGDRIGRAVPLRLLRGTDLKEIAVTIAERSA